MDHAHGCRLPDRPLNAVSLEKRNSQSRAQQRLGGSAEATGTTCRRALRRGKGGGGAVSRSHPPCEDIGVKNRKHSGRVVQVGPIKAVRCEVEGKVELRKNRLMRCFSAPNAVSKAKGQLHAQTRARQDATQERKLREQVRVLLPICLPVCLSAYLSACLPAGLLWKTGDGSAGRTLRLRGPLCASVCLCVPLCAWL